jgi:hypothetical protein
MFEKLPAARMNDRQNSPTEQLIARAQELRGKYALHDASRHFASYLRLLDDFFRLLISKLHRGAARLLAGCWEQFATARAHVAFV